MKKMLIMATVAAVMAFYGCGNNSQPKAEDEGGSAAVDTEVIDAAQKALGELSASIDSKDPAKIQEALADIKDEVAEYAKTDSAAAAAYLTEVQSWLSENEDKVKEATAGDEAAVSSIASLTSTSASDIVSDLKDAGDEAIDEVKESAKDAVDEAKQNAKEKVNDAADNAKDKAANAINDAAGKAIDKLGK